MSAAINRLKVGSAALRQTHVGPLVTRAHKEKVEKYIRIGVDEGTTIAAQALLPTDAKLCKGFFVEPTLLTAVTRNARLAREEIFGPFVTVTVFDTFDDAVVSIASDTDLGLVCAGFSKDTAKATKAAR